MSPPGTDIATTETHYQKTSHSYTLKGYGALTRQASAGPVAELDLSLLFAGHTSNLQKDVDVTLLFGLMDQSAAGIQILRNAATKSSAALRFVEMRPGQEQPAVLREFALGALELSGEWRVRYQHGLLRASLRAKELGCASIQRIGIPIGGVTWLQRGGEVACDHMRLRGEAARELSASDRELRSRASRLNQEAAKFMRDQNFPDALSRMSNASSLYLQVHGEQHHDSANSLVNLATILNKSGQSKSATQLFSKALTIHEVILGANHPHTAMTRFSLGELCFNQKDQTGARNHWTRCRDDLRSVFGPDCPLVKSLDATLSRF